jgi:hypothetical protein
MKHLSKKIDFILGSPVGGCPADSTMQQYRASVDFAHRLSTTIITHLQARYRTHIRGQIENDRTRAQRGAVPGIEHDVVAYLNVLRAKQNNQGVCLTLVFYEDFYANLLKTFESH